jgi:hypothetical protein
VFACGLWVSLTQDCCAIAAIESDSAAIVKRIRFISVCFSDFPSHRATIAKNKDIKKIIALLRPPIFLIDFDIFLHRYTL